MSGELLVLDTNRSTFSDILDGANPSTAARVQQDFYEAQSAALHAATGRDVLLLAPETTLEMASALYPELKDKTIMVFDPDAYTGVLVTAKGAPVDPSIAVVHTTRHYLNGIGPEYKAPIARLNWHEGDYSGETARQLAVVRDLGGPHTFVVDTVRSGGSLLHAMEEFGRPERVIAAYFDGGEPVVAGVPVFSPAVRSSESIVDGQQRVVHHAVEASDVTLFANGGRGLTKGAVEASPYIRAIYEELQYMLKNDANLGPEDIALFEERYNCHIPDPDRFIQQAKSLRDLSLSDFVQVAFGKHQISEKPLVVIDGFDPALPESYRRPALVLEPKLDEGIVGRLTPEAYAQLSLDMVHAHVALFDAITRATGKVVRVADIPLLAFPQIRRHLSEAHIRPDASAQKALEMLIRDRSADAQRPQPLAPRAVEVFAFNGRAIAPWDIPTSVPPADSWWNKQRRGRAGWPVPTELAEVAA